MVIILKSSAHFLLTPNFLQLASLLERDREYIASLETADNGQPYSGIFNNDMGFIIDVFKYYAGWCDKIQGRTMQIGMNYGQFSMF
jgi:aldehyde dehydrogenase (NAD+)